ncbi:MAG TPA: hemerythrin domain-containing protein [Ramlibacter sp.]|jgi:hypothetical protein|nr:hemerythrin domain-containing protein [Ramlibacter sp.]
MHAPEQAANLASPDPAASLQAPIRGFCGTHSHIFAGLQGLRRLPGLAQALLEARSTAQAMLVLFNGDVLRHHGDEEQELFVAVERSARGTPDEGRVDELVSRLTSEHRRIERLWKELRPSICAVAAGRAPSHPAFARAAEELTRAYTEHACLEEEAFLPLANSVLARNPHHMAALDLSLHIRHLPMPRLAYV